MSKKEKIAWKSWLIQLTSSYIYQCVLRSTEGLYTSHLVKFSSELEKHQYSCKHFSQVLFYPSSSASFMKMTFLLYVRLFLRYLEIQIFHSYIHKWPQARTTVLASGQPLKIVQRLMTHPVATHVPVDNSTVH